MKCLAFSADGKRFVSGCGTNMFDSDATVKVWETGTGKELLSFKHPGQIHSLALSPDGKHLVSLAGATMKVWNLEKQLLK